MQKVNMLMMSYLLLFGLSNATNAASLGEVHIVNLAKKCSLQERPVKATDEHNEIQKVNSCSDWDPRCSTKVRM